MSFINLLNRLRDQATGNDYINWLPWEPNNGADQPGGLSVSEEDGVVMDRSQLFYHYLLNQI